jgi:hypothetical protein
LIGLSERSARIVATIRRRGRPTHQGLVALEKADGCIRARSKFILIFSRQILRVALAARLPTDSGGGAGERAG